MPFSQLGDVGLGQDHNVGSPRGNGNYTNLGSNNHGTVLLASNLYMDDGSDNLKMANNHPTMAGAAIQIPGNGQPRQNHIEFWTTPPNAVNQGQDFGDIHNLRVVVTPDGNVGIGTANPTAKPEIRVENEGDWALKLQSGPNDFFDVRPINVGGRFQTELNTANNRDLVILPGTGNVLIGTTVPTTSARLTVEAIGPDSGDFTFAAGVVGRALNPTGVPDLFRQTAGVRGINDDGHGVQGQRFWRLARINGLYCFQS